MSKANYKGIQFYMKALFIKLSILFIFCLGFCSIPVLGCFCKPDWAKPWARDKSGKPIKLTQKLRVEHAFEDSGVIFSGKVVNIEKTDDRRVVKVTFSVYSSWKTDLPKEISVLTNKDSGMCGFEFQKDEEYLVYTYQRKSEDEPFYTSDCTRTDLLKNNKDVKYLHKISKNYLPVKQALY